MSLEKIQLPPFLIQELYKDFLIDEKRHLPASKDNKIHFLGQNKKNILVLVDENDKPFLQENDLIFLTGILKACKLTQADIALVNVHNHTSFHIKDLATELNPVKTILFGVPSSILELPLHFPHFQVQEYNNQTYLSGPDLKEIADNKQLKQQLWESLKKLFSI